MPYLDDFKQVFQSGKEIDKIYTGGSLIWKSNVEYERYNSLLEYTWRQYNTTLQYTWRKYNLSSQTSYVMSLGSTVTLESWEKNNVEFFANISVNPNTGAITLLDSVRNEQTSGVYYVHFSNVNRAGYFRTSGNRYNTSATEINAKKNTTYSKGSYVSTVTSTSSTTYPTNGKSGSYWYDTRTSSRLKSTYRGTVKSTNSTAYPTNGQSGTYWYDTRTSKYIKGSYIDIVEAEEGTLPNGGRHTDGYWYVLKG